MCSGDRCVHSFTTRLSVSHTDSILSFRHTLCTHGTRPQATSADYTAVHRRQPARLRPTTPRRCGSCAAALGRRRRSPARWSTHARAATACKWPRSRSVVRTPEPHSERAMGAALTRATRNRHRVCIGTHSCVRRLTISIAIGAAFGHGTRTRTLSRTLTGREASKCAVGAHTRQAERGVLSARKAPDSPPPVCLWREPRLFA